MFPLKITKYQSVQQRVSSQQFTIRGDATWILEGKGEQETKNDLNPIVCVILFFRILKKVKRKEICLTSNVLVYWNWHVHYMCSKIVMCRPYTLSNAQEYWTYGSLIPLNKKHNFRFVRQIISIYNWVYLLNSIAT